MPTTTHILSDETGQLMLDELEGIHEALDNGTFGGIPMSQKGAANGVATLDASGHVPSGQLPSYVDDVIEGYYYNGAFYSDSAHTTLITGETGKIYVDLSSDTSYRWSDNVYISISNPIDVATQAEALAGNDNTKMMTPLRVKQVVTGDIAPNSVTATGKVKAATIEDSDGTLAALRESVSDGSALPTMSPTTKGGAKLGSGLSVDGDALNLGPLTASGSGASVQTDGSGIFGVTGDGFAHQDGTPMPDSPQEIRVARGRNLLEITEQTRNGITWSDDNGWLSYSGTAANAYAYYYVNNQQTIRLKAGTYTLHATGDRNMRVMARLGSTSGTALLPSEGQGGSFTLSEDSDVAIFGWITNLTSGTTYNGRIGLQLTLGSTPQPYVPYGYIGLDITVNGQTTTTPIPLPAKGFAGALPDGTADTLAIDSAGRWEWTNNADEVVFDGSETWYLQASGKRVVTPINVAFISPSVAESALLCTHFRAITSEQTYLGNVGISAAPSDTNSLQIADGSGAMVVADWKTWLSTHIVTVLYPLATPTTEHGYIDLPELPSGSTVSIPELESIDVEWWVNGADAIAEHGRDVSKANKEQEDRIAELEAAVANLTTG